MCVCVCVCACKSERGREREGGAHVFNLSIIVLFPAETKAKGSPGKGRKMMVHASPPKRRKEPEHHLRASDAPVSTSTPLSTSTSGKGGRGERPARLNEKVSKTMRQRRQMMCL